MNGVARNLRRHHFAVIGIEYKRVCFERFFIPDRKDLRLTIEMVLKIKSLRINFTGKETLDSAH